MPENQKLTDLIGQIYDTALDAQSWIRVLPSLTDYVGAQAGGLVSKDQVSKFATSPYNYGVDPHYVQLYEQTYSEIDPLPALQRLGQIASMPDIVPYEAYRKERFAQEWLLPQRWVDVGMAVLEKPTPNCTVILSLLRNKAGGMVDEKMRQRMALIVPHARRALLISRAMEQKRSEASTFADTLNSLSAATFLVDAKGRIVHANAAAHDMLYANDFLRSTGGHLAARDAKVNQAFRVIFAATAKGDAEAGAKAIALSLIARDGERYVAHVLPLKSGARRATGITYTAVAAVFVRKAALGSPLEAIGQTYKLTPAELRVLQAIVDVGGVPETAAALGVAETTVKTHLYRLFDKTDASRQADLVKLVAGFSNPLVY